MNDRIYFLGDSDLRWCFDSDGKPSYLLDTANYKSTEYVDPFPCYSHNRELVEKEVEHVETTIPLKFKPRWFILSHEGYSRTNGHAVDHQNWETKEPAPYIVLVGKRICIHPAMTRYLIAHEYGHVVDYVLQHTMKIDSSEFRKVYAEFRGVEESAYGARLWHKSVGEIIANDIRIAVLNREVEFWQHDCPKPDSRVTDWWQTHINKYLTK